MSMTATFPQNLRLNAALKQAVAHHRAGRLQDAERLYRAILQAQPNHPEANHNLGILAAQVKKITRRTDEEKGPSDKEVSTLASLFNQGRYTELEPLAQDLTERFPQHGFGWKALGAVLQRQGRGSEALIPMKKAAELLPDSAEVHSNLGVNFKEQGQLFEAEASYRRALEIKPDFAEVHNNLGNVLKDQGRLDEAEASYRRALEIKPDFAEAHNNLGIVLKDQGRYADAEANYRRALEIKPDYVEAHSNLGVVRSDQGRLPEAEASYRRALEIKPDYAEGYSNLGVVLSDQNRLSEAEESYRRALKIKPDYAEAHSNLGVVLNAQGRLIEAEASCRRALEIAPELAEAHCNLGNTLKDQGRYAEAEASYRRALEIKLDYAEVHSNLGNTLKDQGRYAEAEAGYRRALEINPDYVNALDALAQLLVAQGEPITALSLIMRSLQIEETWAAKRIFADCVKHLRFSHVSIDVRDALVRSLSESWGRPKDVVGVGTHVVKINPEIAECVVRVARAWPQAPDDLFGPTGLAAVAADPLLRALLVSTPICDMWLERFLTVARRAMLDAATSTTASDCEDDAVLCFYGSLAQQCFINEYVFTWTDDEASRARSLRDSLGAALEAEARIPALWLLAVGAYFPLHSLRFAGRLLDRSWPEAVTAVLLQQVREPEEERQYRQAMPCLTPIEDEVSLLVQSQYEENPYPRWIRKEPVGKSMTVDGFLRRRFPVTPFTPLGKSSDPDILIAGCGAGQHSIGTAQKFSSPRVLAVDLSLTSLCYAKRKTREFGLSSIEYAQADILKLGALDRRFDVIESSGVLHHLADPIAGWRVLLSLLRPGGFMRLGFYSEVARRDVVRARSFIAEQGYGSTAEDIRRCRQELMNLDQSLGWRALLGFSDFFSISECRDLLFHVQEHRLTLAGINAFLSENDLQFLGFEIDANVLRTYRMRFPEDLAATNLECWQEFENENPDTFLGMYQFWVQKAAGPEIRSPCDSQTRRGI